MKLKPLGDRLIVRAVEEDGTTASGIVMSDAAKEKPQTGEVLAVGEGNWDVDGGKRIPLDIAEGDTVLYSKYGGTEVKVDGEDLLVLRQSDVLVTSDSGQEIQRGSPSGADLDELRTDFDRDIARLLELGQ